jgi:hypothetical protein
MTERPPRRRRVSKRTLRVWAWVTGGLAFLAPFAALGASPNPATEVAQGTRRPVLVVRKITRLVIVRDRPSPAPVRYVSAPSSGSSSTGTVAAAPTSGGDPGGSSPAQAPAAAPPPPPAPTTTTGGS